MDIIAVQKFVRVSPKKMRGVADLAKKLIPTEAVEKLPFLRKRGSEILIKVIKSALASAKQKGLSDNALIFKEIQIGDGPKLKRGRAASRGRWHPYKRRMSHIRVVLTTKMLKDEKINKQEDKKAGPEAGGSENMDLKKKTVGKSAVKSVRSMGKVFKSVVSKGGKTQK